MAPKTTKRCPACNSLEIYIWMGGQAGVIYECNKCGYHGPLVVEEYDGCKPAKKASS